jgi:thiamine kinase-like enzyme
MKKRASPEQVLSQIPGWEGASWRELDQCVTNQPYLVENDGRRAVLKIDEEIREEPFNNRRREAEIQRAAAEAGLAGSVLYVTDTILMTVYVDGFIWSPAFFADDNKLESLATALRKLHSLPLTGRTFDQVGAAHMYAELIDRSLADRVAECLGKVEAGPRPLNLCCCHNDLVVANIISAPETMFLDWEYACDNDPFFDLATIVAHHKLTIRQSDYLLDAYFEGNGARWRDQLQRQMDVYEALLWLWETAWPEGKVKRDQGSES